MTTPFQRAVQPDSPNAKTCDSLSAPPCEHGIPIYPLRYGIADQPYDAKAYPKLSVAGYPALQGGKAYGLRVLRPGAYVYLFFYQGGRMMTTHYKVTADVRFAPIKWTPADYNDAAPGRLARPDETRATPYLLAPDKSTADTVYVMVSDTLLTHNTLWWIETNAGGLRDALAATVKPSGGPAQPHVFDAVLLGIATPEIVPSVSGVALDYPWSEIKLRADKPDYTRILSAMHMALVPRKDTPPLAVALQDPIGIASELGHLCASEVQKRDSFQKASKHRLQSAALIDGYFTYAERQAQAPQIQHALQRQRKLVDLKGARAFRPTYEKALKALQGPVDKTGADVAAWVKLVDASKLVGKAFKLFDLSCADNARDFEVAVLNCLAAAVHTDGGLAELARIIEQPPNVSPLWQALGAGDEPLMKHFATPLTLAKGVFDVVDKMLDERPGTIVTDMLSRLIYPYVATAPVEKADIQVRRWRHLAERRFACVLGCRPVSRNQYLAWSLEVQGYATSPDRETRWKVRVDTAPGPKPGTTRVSVVEQVDVWEFETVGTTHVIGQPKPMDPSGNPLLRNLKRLQGPVGIGFTWIGGGLAIWGMRNAVKDREETKNVTTAAAYLGSLLALVGASLEVTTLTVSTVASRRGNTALANVLKVFGLKWGATVLGSTAAAVLAVTDGTRSVRAWNQANPEQAWMYLHSALLGGLSAFATAAGGAAGLSALAGTTAPFWTLAFSPGGWAVVAILAVGAAIYFTMQADAAQHGPVEILLRHSAWGVLTPRYSLAQELEAWHSLQYSPQIGAAWDPAHGVSGILRLRCTVAATYAVDDLQTDLRVVLRGQSLEKIDANSALTRPGTAINLESHYIIGPLTDGVGVERGWRIAMHKDAQVELKYFFRPDPQKLPTIGVEQPGAPEPLVFTSSGWFSPTIDPTKLVPVRPPK
ncbi:toxin VasX [Burkholderia contaminans]|uniref:toxin VasX n=1 Tax=Burkholderia contaminans TaxID=488447 RepID=UPI00145427B4|nr:toxin VasX [Burkholderia contaminans]MCA8156781.1 hypothetical protein [Burkholderia contaminans]VWD20968.1 hypothetical protein BCO19218_03939 [Burkholderia contaminans]